MTPTGTAVRRGCGALARLSIVGLLVVVLSGCGMVRGTYSAVTGKVSNAVSKVFRSSDGAETSKRKENSMQNGLVKDEGPLPQRTDARDRAGDLGGHG